MMSGNLSPLLVGRLIVIASAFFITACGAGSQSEDFAATFDGGSISFGEVEHRVRAEIDGGHTPEDWLTVYRRAAETMTVENTALQSIEDRDSALNGLGLDYQLLVRQITLELYLKDRVAGPPAIEDEKVQRFFEENPDVFNREGRRYVWHLFRRHEDPDDPQATIELLSSLKRRVVGGEPFMLLAREYSQSETQALDGRLGWVGRGKLPPDLEEIVFSLGEDEVSEPLKVAGGAMLVYVSHIIPARSFEFEEVRSLVVRRLQSLEFESEIRQQIASRPPEGAIILDPAELRDHLSTADDSQVVLKIGDLSLTAQDLLDMVADVPPQPLPFVSPVSQIEEVYRQQVDRQLLYQQALDSGFVNDPENQSEVDLLLQPQCDRLLIDQQVRNLMMAKIDPDALRGFYDDNIYLYQSPLRILVRSWVVPIGEEPAGQLAELERAFGDLVSGSQNLEEAAEQTGGFVTESKWMGPDELELVEPKVVAYLLQLGGRGFSHPYQLNRLFQILEVEEWQEPRALPFHEVEERVRDDYFVRNQQDLYSDVVADVLQGVSFRFNADAVSRRLEVDAAN